MLRFARLGLLLGLALVLAPPATAQTPKAGDWYEDSIELGFKLRLPRDWDFIPPEPGEPNIIGRSDAGTARTIIAADATRGHSWRYQAWILKFDRRDKPKLDANGRRLRQGAKDMEEWLKRNGPQATMRNWREAEKVKQGKLGKIATKEYEFTETMGEDTEVRLYAMLYHLTPEVDIAYVFNGPGGKKWSKHRNAARSLARSFKPVEIEALEIDLGAGTLRDRKRAELMKKVAKSNDWELYETPHYFLISNNEDDEFIDEALERLEAIREVFLEVYPPSMAERLNELAEQARAAAKAEEGEDEEPDDAPRTVVAGEDPMARSTTSVVRICGSREQYQAYGGPPGTGGYWSTRTEELVLFDDKNVQGRDATWNTLNHEAFHQYIYYFFGQLSPHSWYNEGHGDFFGAYEYKRKRYKLTRSSERIRTAQELVRTGRSVPLQELVTWSQPEYYGQNKYDTKGWENYAQGWSLIYFLRTGAEHAKGWNPAWDSILDVYLETLFMTDDLEQAVEEAFEGVDWDELESCWKAYTLE